MSVMTTVEAVPARVAAVVRLVSDLGSIERVLATGLLRPNDPGGMARKVIAEAVGLGLLHAEGDQLRLAEGVTPAIAATPSGLRAWCHEHLIERASERMAENDPFPKALAWFLTRSPGDAPKLNVNWSTFVKADCGGHDLGLSSDARCAQFAYWARWLGYATFEVDGSNATVVVPDPTVALTHLLPSLLSAGRMEPLREVLRRASMRSPVLEEGTVRAEVEAGLHRQRPTASLSQSSSFALLRLQDAGVIELVREADSPATLKLQMIDGSSQLFSHVRLVTGKLLP